MRSATTLFAVMFSLSTLSLPFATPVRAADPAPTPTPTPAPGPKPSPGPAPAGDTKTTASKPEEKKPDEKKPPKGPKPFKEVITAEAKSQVGLFNVHQIDDKYYFEIPANMLGREMLWQTEMEQVGAGRGY